MSLATLMSETVTVYVRSTSSQDSSGVDIDTFTPGSPVPAFVVRSSSASAEEVGDRDLVRSDWQLILNPDVALTAYDRVLVGTHMMEVVGEPRAAVRPGSGANHQVVGVRFLEG